MIELLTSLWLFNDTLCLSYGLHTARVYPRERTALPEQWDYLNQNGRSREFKRAALRGVPAGSTYAVSEDGVAKLRKIGVLFHPCENRSVYVNPDGKLRRLTSAAAKGLISLFIALTFQVARAAQPADWIFACQPDNDLYRVVAAGIGQAPARFDAPSEAVAQASAGAGVLILADGYPQQATTLEPALFAAAAAKNLRLYVEYPASLPELVVDAPKPAGIRRGVVTSALFGAELRPLRIVALHDCRFVPVQATNALLVLAKVAGVDTAVFGLSGTPTDPILFEHPRGRVLVATTKLSHFVTGRYLPSEAWGTIWQTIFR